MTTTAADLKAQILTALDAAESKKAEHVAILQMEKYAFTDYLIICSGGNPRQVQAICDEIELRLKQEGCYPNSVEGYRQAEWVLLDYVDFVVHVFTEEARKFRDLERLWKSATRVTANELNSRPSRARTSPAPKRLPAIPTGARKSSARGSSSRSASPSGGGSSSGSTKRFKSAKSSATAKAIRSASSRSSTRGGARPAPATTKRKSVAKKSSRSKKK